MAQTSVDFANSKPEHLCLATLLREKKVADAPKKVPFNVESCSGGLDVVNSRELLWHNFTSITRDGILSAQQSRDTLCTRFVMVQ